MSIRRAFITGASGFIGSNLTIRLVQQGCDVLAATRSESAAQKVSELGAKPFPLDLTGIEPLVEVPEVEVVFHLAGRLSGTMSELLAVNEAGSRALAEFFSHAARPPVFVHLSSIAAGGPSGLQEPRLEEAPPKPVSDYGRSKLASERAVCKQFARLPISIVRPGIVFGPGDREFLRLLQTMNKIYLIPVIGFGNTPFAFIEVTHLVDLLILVAEKGERVQSLTADGDAEKGIGLYHASSLEPLSFRELGKLFVHSLNRPVIPLPIPREIAFLVGIGGEWFSKLTKIQMTLTRDKIREATASAWDVSCKKAIRQLGWHAPSIEATMCRWIRRAREEHLL